MEKKHEFGQKHFIQWLEIKVILETKISSWWTSIIKQIDLQVERKLKNYINYIKHSITDIINHFEPKLWIKSRPYLIKFRNNIRKPSGWWIEWDNYIRKKEIH